MARVRIDRAREPWQPLKGRELVGKAGPSSAAVVGSRAAALAEPVLRDRELARTEPLVSSTGCISLAPSEPFVAPPPSVRRRGQLCRRRRCRLGRGEVVVELGDGEVDAAAVAAAAVAAANEGVVGGDEDAAGASSSGAPGGPGPRLPGPDEVLGPGRVGVARALGEAQDSRRGSSRRRRRSSPCRGRSRGPPRPRTRSGGPRGAPGAAVVVGCTRRQRSCPACAGRGPGRGGCGGGRGCTGARSQRRADGRRGPSRSPAARRPRGATTSPRRPSTASRRSCG